MTELWVVQEQQLAIAILATQYHVGSPCWSPGSLLPCRAESPQFSCSFQIPPLVSPFPLTSLLCTFTSPYNSVRGVCHFPCAHRHTIAPLFTWLYLHHPYLQHWSTINKHIPWSDHKRLRNTNTGVFLSSWVEAILAFLSKGVCICTHVCDHIHT